MGNKSSETSLAAPSSLREDDSRSSRPPKTIAFRENSLEHPPPEESFPTSHPLLYVPCVDREWWSSARGRTRAGVTASVHLLIDAEESTLLRQFGCTSNLVRGTAAYMFGSYCALGCLGQQLEICDVAGQKLVQRLPHLHTARVRDSCWIGHHGLLATGSDDQSVRLWRINDDTLESAKDFRVGTLQDRQAARGQVTAVRCRNGPWRDRVVTGSAQSNAHIWDLLTYKHVRSLPGGHSTGVHGVELSETHDLVALCARGIRVFDTRTYEMIFENSDLSFCCRSMWSKTRNLLVMCGHFNAKISVYDIRRPSTPYARWRNAHGASQISGCCEIDAECFSTAASDQCCKVWTYGGKLLRDFKMTSNCLGVCLYGAEALLSHVAAEDVEERVQYLVRSLLASHGSVQVEVVGGGSMLIPAAFVLE